LARAVATRVGQAWQQHLTHEGDDAEDDQESEDPAQAEPASARGPPPHRRECIGRRAEPWAGHGEGDRDRIAWAGYGHRVCEGGPPAVAPRGSRPAPPPPALKAPTRRGDPRPPAVASAAAARPYIGGGR